MTNGHDRRRFLGIVGTGAAASLAGCTDFAALGGQDETDDTLTVAVGPDPDEIEELVAAMESGELDPREAQQRQQQLIEESVAEFQQRAEENSDVTIEESTEEMGLFRVDAPGDFLIDALREGAVSSIHTSAAYDRFLEQQRQQQQAPRAPPEDGGNETESGASEADETDNSSDGQ